MLSCGIQAAVLALVILNLQFRSDMASDPPPAPKANPIKLDEESLASQALMAEKQEQIIMAIQDHLPFPVIIEPTLPPNSTQPASMTLGALWDLMQSLIYCKQPD